MAEYFSLNINDEKIRHKNKIYIRPEDGKKIYPNLVIYNGLNILPSVNREVSEWINEYVKNPFYMVAIGDLGVDGVIDETVNRIVFTDQKDFMYFKLKWS